MIRADFGGGAGQGHAPGAVPRPAGTELLPGQPTVDPGTYFRSRISLIWREDISSHFARPGIGAQVYLENGQGDLQYTSASMPAWWVERTWAA